VNWLYDLFFTSKVPGLTAIKDLLNVIALVNALLLGAGLALASSVNRDELVAADDLWFNDPTSPLTKWYKSPSSSGGPNASIPPSSILHEDTEIALSLFFVGLIGVVWIYTDMLSKTRRTKDKSYWLKFFEQRDKRGLKNYYGFFDTVLGRIDPLVALEMKFDEVGDMMWDTPDRRAAATPFFDEQRDERWKRQLAIEHCLFRAPHGFTPRPEIEVEVKVYSQMSVDTLGKLLANLQNEEARVYEREVLMRDKRREREGNLRGHAFYLWWGFAKYSILLLIATTTFGCIFSIFAMRDLYIIKYPDAWIEKYGYSDVAHGLSNASSPSSYGNVWYGLIFEVCAIIVVLSTGLGTARKVRMTMMILFVTRSCALPYIQYFSVPSRKQISQSSSGRVCRTHSLGRLSAVGRD